jgi:hypothetical protein
MWTVKRGNCGLSVICLFQSQKCSIFFHKKYFFAALKIAIKMKKTEIFFIKGHYCLKTSLESRVDFQNDRWYHILLFIPLLKD